MNIKQVIIHGLFGSEKQIIIPFVNNKIIIIGPNGIGKSTILNIFYYSITQQWTRLEKMEFASVELFIDETQITFSREKLPLSIDFDSIYRYYPPRIVRFLHLLTEEKNLEAFVAQKISQEEESVYKNRFRLDEDDFKSTRNSLLRRFGKNKSYFNSEVSVEVEKLNACKIPKVLYLPTYRRIEKDLSALLHNLNDDDRHRLSSRFKEEYEKTRESTNYKELIEFGMADISKIIAKIESHLKDFVRDAFNDLTGSYLADVVKGEIKLKENSLSNLDKLRIEYILTRFENKHMADIQTEEIVDMLNDKKTDSETKSLKRDYTLHFISILSALVDRLEKEEKGLQNFISTTNKYLDSKKFTYDYKSSRIFIMSQDKEVPLDVLSSGEKQIVSLFAELYLNKIEQYYVIIDEPELSLSVTWQTTVLPDICLTNNCMGIATVTHSPFIFENYLEESVYTMDYR